MEKTTTRKHSYSSHEYDVILTENYNELCKLIDKADKLTVSNKEGFVNLINTDIEDYCNRKNISRQSPAIIIHPTDPIYVRELARMLMWFDPIKISRLLDYHKGKYQWVVDFANLVEYNVYNIVNANTPIENTVRLDKIMQWVEKQPKTKKSKLNIEQKTFIWQGDEPSKKELYEIMLQELIEEIEYSDFEIIFGNQPAENVIHKIKWKELYHGQINRRSIFRLLYSLKQVKLLSEDNFDEKLKSNVLYQKTESCFADVLHGRSKGYCEGRVFTEKQLENLSILKSFLYKTMVR